MKLTGYNSTVSNFLREFYVCRVLPRSFTMSHYQPDSTNIMPSFALKIEINVKNKKFHRCAKQ